jgi:predicted MFS family arabinose efflux permease
LLASLNVGKPDISALHGLGEAQWRQLLKLCDRSQLTLLLGHAAGEALPDWIEDRLRQNNRGNVLRFARLKKEFAAVSQALTSNGIEFVVLKGFTHSPEFTPDPLLRAQGDLDLWCSEGTALRAQDVLLELGYRPRGAMERRHLAPLALPSAWEWTGDYFAPELPVSVELHYRLWDDERQFDTGVSDREFWARRRIISVDGDAVTALALPDTLAFAALHLLMHLLRGDLRLQRAWEIANFIETHHANQAFWRSWRALYPAPLLQLQTIVFLLVTTWFGGHIPVQLAEEAAGLPSDVELWLEQFGWSPVAALFHPHKDEVWLHMALAVTWQRKMSIFADRLIPIRAAAISGVFQTHANQKPLNWTRITARFLLSRLMYHSTTFAPAIAGYARWWWLRQRLGRDFVRFQCASVLFTFGAFIFFLLYSLHLLDLGYREDFIGRVQSAMTAGTLLGVAPAAYLSRKHGVGRTLTIALVGGALAMLLRATVSGPVGLLTGATLNGLFFSGWAVCLSPAVAEMTTEKNRAVAFSLVSAAGVGTGILGGYVGGYLPGLLSRSFGIADGGLTRRLTLIVGTILLTSALIPISRLRFTVVAPLVRNIYPRSRFIVRYLAALALWMLATGLFNPFANVYLTRIWHLNVTSIGRVSAYSHGMQVAGMLASPILLRRLGAGRGIALTQIAAAGALGLIGIASGSTVAAVLYVGYMCLQYAGEPGLFHLLMSGVEKRERNGASAMHFLISSVAGSIAALAGGAAIGKFGYGPVLGVAALLAAIAAVLFGFGVPASSSADTPISAPAEST